MSSNEPNPKDPNWVSPGEATRYCGYSHTTLRNWAEAGKIRFTRTPRGKRYYYLPDIQNYCGIQDAPKDKCSSEALKRTLLYARVSSNKQKPDLDRQIQFLQCRYPNRKLYSDVGFGLNYNRKGLQRVLGEIASGTVKEIVVTYTDRLCRYGLELLEWIFREHSVQLVVLCDEVLSGEGTEEFAKDILDVCNYFVAKYNGKKSGQYRRARKFQENWGTQEDAESMEIPDYSGQPDETEGELALEAARYLYNRSVQLLLENPEMKVTLKNLRRLLVTDCNENILLPQIKQEFQKVPYDVRDGAIRDFIKAFSTQKKLVAQGKKRYFEMSYMSRHYRNIVINHKHFRILGEKEITAFPYFWGGRMFCKEGFPQIKHDVRLVKKESRYYLLIPISQDIPKKVKTGEVVGLDPGVRSFQTTYGTNGKSYSIGKDCISKIDRISQIACKLREGIKRVRQFGKKTFKEVKKTKGMSRKSKKLEESIKNKISDIHRNTCKFLCSQYDVVVLPEFRSQKISEKKDSLENWKRKIGKTTTRTMIRWSHFSFRSLLIAKGIQTGTKVVIGTEEYTSKTCTNCLKINDNLGSNKTFKCSGCSLIIDRDINGARNILLKNWEKAGLSYKPVRLVTLKRFGLPSSQVTGKVQTNSGVLKLSV